MLSSLLGGERMRLVRTKIEAGKDPLRVGSVADNLADGRGQLPHDLGHSQDLIALRERRIFQQINGLLEIAKCGDCAAWAVSPYKV
jgi:hypothetical protein